MVKPLRVGILIQHDSGWAGGTIYIQNLVRAIAALPIVERSPIELYLITKSDIDHKAYQELEPLVTKVCKTNCLNTNFLNRLWWKVGRTIPFAKDARLVQLTQQEQLDFLYPVIGNGGASWGFECSWAAWIPDFQHKYLPNFFSSKEVQALDAVFQLIAQNAPVVVLSSHVAEADFKKFYPYSKAKTCVLRFCTIPEPSWFAGDPTAIQKKYNLKDSFFLVSNQFWIHKNHRIIIEALEILKQEDIKPTVVCTGALNDRRFPGYGDEILRLVHDSDLRDQFITLGFIPRTDQIQLMRRSLAVIQPSLFEGWSTVVEDARLLGKRLILSNLPVHFEQDPPDARFFQQDSASDLAAAIKQVLPDLTPGPNLEAEEQSKQVNQVQCKAYARQFLEIVQAAGELRNSRIKGSAV